MEKHIGLPVDGNIGQQWILVPEHFLRRCNLVADVVPGV
jgi:hypothetical protein